MAMPPPSTPGRELTALLRILKQMWKSVSSNNVPVLWSSSLDSRDFQVETASHSRLDPRLTFTWSNCAIAVIMQQYLKLTASRRIRDWSWTQEPLGSFI
jgi:hypothetical protein